MCAVSKILESEKGGIQTSHVEDQMSAILYGDIQSIKNELGVRRNLMPSSFFIFLILFQGSTTIERIVILEII